MKEVVLEAKTKEEAIRMACEKLNASTEEIVYSIEEEKGKLFKAASYKIKAITFLDLAEQIKEYLKEVIANLGLEINFESTIREHKINIGHTDGPVQVLMEKNGFTNQKLFNRVFKELYGCTPLQARKG